MTRSFRGRFQILGLTALVLAGCAGQMTRDEAQDYANRRIARYCGVNCGPYHLSGAQRVKGRWLVDFDAPRHKVMVAVDDGGNTEVSVWDK